MSTPIVSQAMTMMTFGTSAISASGLAALGLCYSFFGDVQSIFMPSAAHAARLHDTMRMSRRGLCMAIALALLVGFAVTIIYVISMAYDQGASNFNSWFFRVSSGAGVRSFDDVMAKIKTPADFHTQKLGFFSIGAVAMTFLTFMQYRFPWWPLHPIGFPIMTNWLMEQVWFSVFLAWLIKVTILRYGGATLFVRSRYFFLGLLVGQALTAGLSLTIDYVTGSVGNYVFGV